MQKLIEDNFIDYMCDISSELSILDLSNEKFINNMRKNIILKLQNEENKDYIKELHNNFTDRLSLEIIIINYYDKLLQRSSQYIVLWHEILNKYIEECESFSLIYNNNLDLDLVQKVSFKPVALNEFKSIIENLKFQTLKLISSFCTDIVSDL